MANGVTRLANIIATAQRNAQIAQANTTAAIGTFNAARQTVNIGGEEYACATASHDLNLIDGCPVYCLPSGGGAVIVGGGV